MAPGKNVAMYTAQPLADSTAVMGKRFGAFIIDAVIAVVIFAIAFLAFSETFTKGELFDSCEQIRDLGGSTLCLEMGDNIRYAEGGDAGLIYLIGIVFSLVNGVALQAQSGTIGKRLVGIAVVRQDTGAPLGFGKAILRWIVTLLDVGCCFLIGLIMALTTKGHRRLADMAAKSVVVDRSSMGRPPSIPGQAVAAPQWGPAPGAPGSPPWPQSAGQQPPAAGQWAPPSPAVPPAAAPPSAPSGPQWDPTRNAYVQQEPGSGRWLQYDDASQEWRPLS
jgi:uncharacterized RDD family membrane protein YckC